MRLFPNIVLKHEGNMPFENDGLRGRMTGYAVTGDDNGGDTATGDTDTDTGDTAGDDAANTVTGDDADAITGGTVTGGSFATEATYYKRSNLRDLLPATSHNHKQSSGFASQQAQDVRKHKDVRVLRKVTNKMTSAKNRPERFFVSASEPEGRVSGTIRAKLGGGLARTYLFLCPQKSAITRKRHIAQQRTTVFIHHTNPKEIPECGYFLIVLKHEGNMPFENDGLREGNDRLREMRFPQ